MRNTPIIFIFCLVLSSTAYGQISLFNGKDLTGWKIHGTEKWFVQNGELICESGPDKQYGYLASAAEFKDFDLELEFFQESNGNSGVFFHSQVEGTKVSGWQAEVAPMNQHTGGIYESYGRGWLIKPEPAREKFLKENSWNHMRVRVQGNVVETWLNGNQMIRLEDAKIGSVSGKISLQIHDGGGVRVRWRNLKITSL
ncbi:MAG: 3-keto-disaccharide hydrolase [Cyclobacteriaceae bacterium]